MNIHDKLRTLSAAIFIIFGCSVRIFAAQGAVAQADFEQITSARFSEVEMGYALEGECGVFSPNGTSMVVVGDGLYDLVTGKRRFETSDQVKPNIAIGSRGRVHFSPDNRLLAIDADGMYDTNTGEKVLAFSGKATSFSPDGKLLILARDGVYDVRTKREVLDLKKSIDFNDPVFSPDGSLLAVTRDGVYDLKTGRKLYDTDHNSTFSHDNRWIIQFGGGVYAARTGDLLISLCPTCGAVVSPSSSLLAINGDGLYDLPSFNKRFSFGSSAHGYPAFSPDESLVVADVVYDVRTGDQVASAPASENGHFSQDGSWFAASNHLYRVSDWSPLINLDRRGFMGFALEGSVMITEYDGMYNTSSGEHPDSMAIGQTQFNESNTLIAVESSWQSVQSRTPPIKFCQIYGLPGSKWPYRSGLAHVDARVNLRTSPSRNSEIAAATSNADLPIFATTADGDWYRVGHNMWVSTQVVQTVYLPDAIPVEGD